MIGETIAHYHITAKLGEGGMGEVYRATDTKLNREVALKILRFTSDRLRMARFQREARVLASLNHPHIGAIHGIEDAGDSKALVLELIEGPTLADRLRAGSPSLEEACRIAAQIADALEAAHEKGIVHRDLKPANIKLTLDGEVKVLDFGLAKPLSLDSAPVSTDTDTELRTQTGALLGTPAYMSPEQAKGEAADARSDIWAFGVVLFELLAGRHPFRRQSTGAILYSVLDEEPDWSLLPTRLPASLVRLLERCLRKDPRRRLRHIGDARLELEELKAEQLVPAVRTRDWRVDWRVPMGLLAAGALAAVLTIWALWPPAVRDPDRVVRLRVSVLEDVMINPSVPPVISPDGSRFVYSGLSESGSQLFLHDFNSFTSRPIAGTEGGVEAFFSPDGQWLGFLTDDDKLKKLRLSGGQPETLAEARFYGGGTWGPGGNIVIGNVLPGYRPGLWAFSADGGDTGRLTTTNGFVLDEPEEAHLWPQFLPGRNVVLFTNYYTPGVVRIEALDLDTTERHVVVSRGSYARYVPPGQLVYAWGGDLYAAPFNIDTVRVTGTPRLVLTGVATQRFALAPFDVAADGTLVYVPGPLGYRSRPVWADLSGTVEPIALPPAYYSSPRVAPAGDRVILRRADEAHELWLIDLGRLEAMRRLSSERTASFWPLWFPSGERVAFNSNRAGGPASNLWSMTTDGTVDGQPMLRGDFHYQPQCWSPDGRTLFTSMPIAATGSVDISILSPDGQTAPVLATSADETHPSLSPDGKWLAYASDQSGRGLQVYLRRFPDGGDLQLVSAGPGRGPLWAPDGSTLYYRDERGAIHAIPVDIGDGPNLGSARIIVEGPFAADLLPGREYDLAPDGSRFLLLQPEVTGLQGEFHAVINWLQE